MEIITQMTNPIEDRVSGIEDKVDKLLHSSSNKGKKSNHEHDAKTSETQLETKPMNVGY
jgi:hypothetical protein